MSSLQLQMLSEYTACDISDALQKLGIRDGGFLPDLISYGDQRSKPRSKLIGPVSTVLFAVPEEDGETSAPLDKHWVDRAEPDTIVLISQPEGQHNGVLGGITARRLKDLDVLGVVVHGRVRDVRELSELGLPILAKGSSTVSPNQHAKVRALNVPLDIQGFSIIPGDIAFSDDDGVVVIPKRKLDEILRVVPGLVEGDNKAMAAVMDGTSVTEAFRRFRGGCD